ncbi:MAG: helix-hairpin-helix domain-containing protein, partial [Clostridia bacterium]|nr:helix-hairpin-helix domain-containing protein [Clostridia bacterium]
GINSAVAKNVVAYREENGAFTDRKQLLKVKGLGAKAYEQCAGFLRVAGGKNPLDNTSVHPESYAATEKLLAKYGISVKNFTPQVVATIPFPEDDVSLTALADELELGVPTLKDIIKELKKPARDPRDELPAPLLRDGKVMEISDLSEGMVLTGTVRNVIDFGCFVDIGVHEDGLVHISQICDRFIKHPLEAVKVGEVVKVKVLSVDVQRKRISLTMKF